MTTSERIARFAYGHWNRAGMTEWPTVRQAARALNVSQGVVQDHEGNDYDLTGYDDDQLGDLLVEAVTDDVERDWCAYWLPYSHQCICGEHSTVCGSCGHEVLAK